MIDKPLYDELMNIASEVGELEAKNESLVLKVSQLEGDVKFYQDRYMEDITNRCLHRFSEEIL